VVVVLGEIGVDAWGELEGQRLLLARGELGDVAECPSGREGHTRSMVPLRLSWAWTVWKAQGQTMRGKIVVHLGSTEVEDGLTYVAMSRATDISCIGHPGLTLERLTTKIAATGCCDWKPQVTVV